jgi:hypothetical protein
MAHWWRGGPKPCVHHASHMDWLRVDPGSVPVRFVLYKVAL